jgi:hypothetical protein
VDKINITPADLNDKGKQASGFFKSNYKKIISAFLLLMIVLTMIMELSIDMEFTFRDLGNYVILITIYILNLVVNADDGKDAGRRDKRYTAAKGDYSTINDRVIECGSSRYLEAFCRQRREDNLIERRRAALSRANIGYAKYLREYIGHKPPRELSKDKREAIKWANGMRMENLSPNMLLTAGKKVENHRIMGAAIEVFPLEPLPKDCPFLHMDNVTLTNHRGGDTVNCYSDSPEYLLTALDAYLSNGKVPKFHKGAPLK